MQDACTVPRRVGGRSGVGTPAKRLDLDPEAVEPAVDLRPAGVERLADGQHVAVVQGQEADQLLAELVVGAPRDRAHRGRAGRRSIAGRRLLRGRLGAKQPEVT